MPAFFIKAGFPPANLSAKEKWDVFLIIVKCAKERDCHE